MRPNVPRFATFEARFVSYTGTGTGTGTGGTGAGTVVLDSKASRGPARRHAPSCVNEDSKTMSGVRVKTAKIRNVS